ncbi:hypothetical protein Tco_0363145 [Tanacetum coccineum]
MFADIIILSDCANMGTTRLRRDRSVLVMVAGLPRTVYHDLYLGGKALAEKENVGLRVADSHTGNHPEDDFTPLETIRRSYSIIREKIPFEFERETFEPEREAYGGEPSVDLLRPFLNLGRTGDWLIFSNKGGVDVPKALIKPVTYLEYWKEMDFSSIMIQGVDGEFNFLPEGGFDDNQGSFSAKSMNKKTPIINAEPISVVLPANVADNIIDSNNTPSDDELSLVHPPPTSSLPEARRAPVQASKVASDTLTPLDVDSDPDIHGKFKPLYGVVAHVTPPSWKQHLRDISIEQLCDIHDRASIRQAVLNNMLNGRTRDLISALNKARASCDAIREREREKGQEG